MPFASPVIGVFFTVLMPSRAVRLELLVMIASVAVVSQMRPLSHQVYVPRVDALRIVASVMSDHAFWNRTA